MARLVFALIVVLTGCSGTTYRWQPSRVSQVPDSMPVRFIPANATQPMTGRSLGWQTAEPRVVTVRGDTLRVPTGTRVAVKARGKTGHPLAGALVGWGVGIGVSLASCTGETRSCGEQDPTPLLSASVGALIGAAIRTDRWVRLRWP